MKFFKGSRSEGTLDTYEVESAGVRLSVANEHGDCRAVARRSNGTAGVAYGGPRYDTASFSADSVTGGLTSGERQVADGIAKRAGWFK